MTPGVLPTISIATTQTQFPSALGRQALALLPPVAAVAIQLALWRFIDPYAWFLFYPAVFISSWLGGRAAGLWATAISVAAVWWLFIPPRFSLAVEKPAALFTAAVFVGMGVLFSLFHDRLRKANQQATEALHALGAASERVGRPYEATVFNNTMDAILIADADKKIVAVNPAYTNMTGFEPADVIGKNPGVHKSGRHDTEFYRALWRTLQETGHWQGEIWNRRKNGEVYPAWENISVVKDDHGRTTHYVSVMSDISPLKRAEERLSHLAHHDALTNLPNRLTFSSHLEQALERAKRHQQKLALLLLDLDRFKNVNDTLGHDAGDQLLQIVATRLRHCLRSEDLVARLGGDEFAIVLEEVSRAEDAGATAEKINRAVAEPAQLVGGEVVTSASIGISIYPDDADNAADLAKGADASMYRAKSRGRDTYEFYTAEMTILALKRLSIENELRLALARNEFVLHYQPQIELASGRTAGLEALLRWRHPERGLLLPADFIEIAEKSGVIDAIGDWVIHQACAQVRLWHNAGLSPGRVAINLCGREILYDHKPQCLRSAMEQNGFTPGDVPIQIEIRESVLQSGENIVSTLNQFRRLGSSIAIDNFGTGHSSLSQLKRLPIDTLKVDRSVIRGISQDSDHQAVVSAILLIGRSLGWRVIAQGVETPEQLAFLRERGVDEVQGFLISEALAPDHVGSFISNRRSERRA
ncbi:MAG: putative bifunctional diguanylate cyclase/phosphodiesterase [Steroidobacterales bacterium]